MDRSDVGFAASAAGAAMMVAGAAGYAQPWVFVAAGAVLALSGLVSLGLRGALWLAACGAWVAASPWVAGTGASWNLMAAGILATGLGFTVGVAGSAASASPAD